MTQEYFGRDSVGPIYIYTLSILKSGMVLHQKISESLIFRGQKSDLDENCELSANFFIIRPLEVKSPDSIELSKFLIFVDIEYSEK